MSLADDGRRGDDTLTVFTAFTFLTVAVTFFPEQANEILAAAVLTGEITQEDAIALALLAGANPEDVSTETAAGGDITAVPAPLGAGVGAGGAGGGDTTASTN